LAVSSLSYARVGPVHFQPLEWELAPIAEFVSGRLLNAGCGYRDIGPLLRRFGANEVANMDIETNIPGAILGSLDAMPFPENDFDTVLCNAVLEHVGSADAVMKELFRVLRPNGHAIVAIPFLQPYHKSPRDFRRYTVEGMESLGLDHGFEIVAIKPVHTIAQTLGWILWEHLLERNTVLGQRIFWPLIWAATRYMCRSDQKLIGTANTFQAIYRKPNVAL